MLLSLQAILPLFLMIALGYLAKRTVFDIKMLPGLNQFVYFLAVPALLFNASSKESLESLINLPSISAFLLGIVLTALITVAGCRIFFSVKGQENLVLRGLNSVFANYAYMGIPLTFGVIGDKAYGATVSIILIGNVLLIGGAQLLLELFRQKGWGGKQIFSIIDRSLLRNPIFLSTVLGLTLSANELKTPEILQTVIDMLAPAAIPVALFCLGASLQFSRNSMAVSELGWLMAVKLIAHPALTWGSFYLLGINDPVWLITAVLLTSLPTGALVHVVALKYDVFEKETSQIVVASTLLSLISVTLWASLML
ncbi:AEC family transporter [Motiliproteus sp. MSK22-1]|uniref:AEC family transporter n=1 Tax=Motiliproteus sp. MSK22-1 TaxID=1897630 RepID=UPI00117D6548|nr:AEC family transporter [Motiliproteus sp. MSK22-1]